MKGGSKEERKSENNPVPGDGSKLLCSSCYPMTHACARVRVRQPCSDVCVTGLLACLSAIQLSILIMRKYSM